MKTVTIGSLNVGDTVEAILHHNYPLALVKGTSGLVWAVTKNSSGAKSKFVTHIVGRLTSVDADITSLQIYGGPYTGQGFGSDMLFSGDSYNALATIPWNYIMRLWVFKQVEIPTISAKYGRMNLVKTRVTF